MVFDQYQRYETIKILVNYVKYYYNIDKLNILEVGSNEQLNLGKFLPNEIITYSDLSVPSNIYSNINFIQADATNLNNIKDQEFDIVISSDVFEHIPKDKRENFLKETNRVSKLLSLHCFPFESEAIINAELRANEYYKAIFGRDHIWLKEHIDNGLPNINDVKCILDSIGKNYFAFEHGDILLWEDMTNLLSYTEYFSQLIPLRNNIEDFYKKNIFLHDIGESNYRKFVIITEDLGFRDYLEKNISSRFDGEVSQKNLKFLYKNIQNMKDISQIRIHDIQSNIQSLLYIDNGSGFHENEKLNYEYKIDSSKGFIDIFINIEQGTKKIRFDPIEGKQCALIGLNILSNNGVPDYNVVNGYSVGDCIAFNNTDPQIIIDFSEKPIEWLKIEANICIFEDDLYNEVFKQLCLALNSNNLSDKNIKSKSESTKVTITIFNLIKKILKSNRYTHIFCKVLKSLKQKGIKYTIKKIKLKIENSTCYDKYMEKNKLSDKEREVQVNTKFEKDIKFSIIVPLYNTPKHFLCEMVNSCIDQTYSNWELCLADGSDKEYNYIKEIVESYIKKDNRIKYKKLQNNNGISENTNECIKMSTGEYIGLLDHDDLLHPSALYEYMKAICDKDADFIYCDELTFEKNIYKPTTIHFKPDFAIDNLRAYNYICHFTVFRKDLLETTGMFRKEFDGSQDHDIIFRLTEQAKNIIHIPKVLYYWRNHSNSVSSDINSKPYAIEAGKNAVREHLKRRGLSAIVESSKEFPTIYRLKYEIKENPLISILIPNKDNVDVISTCINSILNKSTYKNIEIIIIENNSVEQRTFEYYNTLKDYKNIKVIKYESNGEFNYSCINNFGVKYANGEHLLFLNNDIEIISENWIEEMLMYSQREDVGAVGAKLYYSNNTIQHAGVILGIGGFAGHSHRHFDRNLGGYFSRCMIQQNLSAVTAACFMMKRSIFNDIGGFDELFKVALNDVDLCMRIGKAGYLIVWTPYAELYHYESVSRGYEDTPEKKARFNSEIARFQKIWGKELEQGDPYYNVNLTLDREDFSLR